MPRPAHPTKLAAILEQQGRKKKWLAEMIGVTPTTMGRWVNGQDPVPEHRQGQIAKLLGKDVAEVFPS